MKRRVFLGTALATGAATGLTTQAVEDSEIQIFDSNASLFRWPFRRLPLDETAALLQKMRSLGVTHAFAGSFEGIFQRDLADVNRRLAKECRKFKELIPIGSVNPNLPGWEKEIRICAEEHGMPGIRLHPNYHGYALDDPHFQNLLKLATKAEMFVQLATTMEDVRTQNSLATVPDVDLNPLSEVVAKVPGSRVQLLNWRPREAELESMQKVSGIIFDTARVDGTDGIEKLQETVSPERVLFGTHAPFLIPEAALIRLMHESRIEDPSLRKIAITNAQNLITKSLR